MSWFEAIILGLVQGLTEFLPVSSSGHLVLIQKFFNLDSGHLLFSVVAHMGSLLAILLFYKKDFLAILRGLFDFKTPFLVNPSFRLMFLVIVASIPAAIVGLFFKNYVELLFGSQFTVGVAFLVTGGLLMLSRLKSSHTVSYRTGFESLAHQITFTQALIIGIFQAFAICPGLSRAGFTITSALFLGFKKQEAAFFSFLISIPAILGATLLEALEVQSMTNYLELSVLFISSLTFGLFGLWGIVAILNKGKLHLFSFYLIPLGLSVLFFLK